MDTGRHSRSFDPRVTGEQVHRLHWESLLAELLLTDALALPRRALTAAAACAPPMSLDLENLFAARRALLVRVVNIKDAAVHSEQLLLLFLRDKAPAVPEAFVGEVLAAVVADFLLRLHSRPLPLPVAQNPLTLLFAR